MASSVCASAKDRISAGFALYQLRAAYRAALAEGTPADLPTHKAALAAKKAQGKRLGNPVLTAAADKRDEVLRPILQKLAGQSLRAIAAELDRRGIKSWSGKQRVFFLRARGGPQAGAF
jgi:hypothetical protein